MSYTPLPPNRGVSRGLLAAGLLVCVVAGWAAYQNWYPRAQNQPDEESYTSTAAPTLAPAVPPAPAAHPPKTTVLWDEALAAPPSQVWWNAVATIGSEGRRNLVAILAAHVAERWELRLLRSLDAGQSWQPTKLAALDSNAEAIIAQVAMSPTGAVAVVVFAQGADGLRARLSSWPLNAPSVERASDLRVPSGLSPLRTGTSLLLLPEPALVLTRQDGRGVLWRAPFTTRSLRDLPAGRVLSATASPSARITLARSSATGFVELAQVAVPDAQQAWPEPTTTRISYVATLQPSAGPDLSCGLRGEPYATFLGHGDKQDVLVAASASEVYPFRFSPAEHSTLDVLCGSCPPAVLEKSARGLRILLAVRRQLAPATVSVSPAFDESSQRSATASCTSTSTVVAYTAGAQLLTQHTHGGTWQFDAAVPLAEQNSDGKPEEPKLLSVGDRVIALWRRVQAGSNRLRIEAALL